MCLVLLGELKELAALNEVQLCTVCSRLKTKHATNLGGELEALRTQLNLPQSVPRERVQAESEDAVTMRATISVCSLPS
jgi:hypothetical protein